MARARRLRDAQRRLRLQRHRRPRARPEGRTHAAAAARQRARVGAVRLGADRLLCAIGLVVLLQLNRDGRDRRARQPRAGRGLSVHEAHHLVAAGVARPRLFVGRAGRLAGGDRQPRLAGGAAVARQHLLGDRLRHALRDPGYRGRRAGRGQILGAAARRDKAPLGIAICYALALLLWGAAIWSVRPDWLALLALAPAALHLANQALRATRRTASWRCGCSARTAPAACSSSSRCWSSGSPRVRRSAMLSPEKPAASPNPLVERGIAAGADRRRRSLCRRALGGRAGPPGRARQRQPLRRRGDRPPPVRRPALGDRRLVGPVRRSARRCWSSDAWRWRSKRRRTPMPGSRPHDLLQRGAPPVLDFGRRPRARSGRASRAGAGSGECRARGPRNHQFQRRRRERVGRDHRAGDLGRLLRRLRLDRPQLSRRRWSPAKAHRCSATMPGTASAISTTSSAPNGRPPRRGARRRPAQSDAAQAGQISGAFRSARRRLLLGHFAGAITGGAVARKTSFLQDKLGSRCSRRA